MSSSSHISTSVNVFTRRQQLEALASVHLNNPELDPRELAAKAWFGLITNSCFNHHQATDILTTLLADATQDKEYGHILTTALALVDILPVLRNTALQLSD